MRPGQCTAAESPLKTQPEHTVRPVWTVLAVSEEVGRCSGLTQQDLQGVGVQIQSLRLLLHHVHLLRLLVVVAVDAGVGQHLQTGSRAQLTPRSALSRTIEDEGGTFRA